MDLGNTPRSSKNCVDKQVTGIVLVILGFTVISFTMRSITDFRNKSYEYSEAQAETYMVIEEASEEIYAETSEICEEVYDDVFAETSDKLSYTIDYSAPADYVRSINLGTLYCDVDFIESDNDDVRLIFNYECGNGESDPVINWDEADTLTIIDPSGMIDHLRVYIPSGKRFDTLKLPIGSEDLK